MPAGVGSILRTGLRLYLPPAPRRSFSCILCHRRHIGRRPYAIDADGLLYCEGCATRPAPKPPAGAKQVCRRHRRCNRCLKLSHRLAARRYQDHRGRLLATADRDDRGRLKMTIDQINTLMHLRLAVGRTFRRWKRGQR